ncbi:aminotransferase class I/II-fold pyridoxal phosphate-dependent enzyme [Candidatus Thorarchaeota archaeon]|nr:MAG: aminotransferase class I/II-fold pyridoxal phosphate-dependent enzyme [Candidatus Thorarchaeota archaeon]
MNQNLQLDSLRAEIQKVTLDIVSLTEQRRKLVQQVAKEKLANGIPLVNLDVEKNLRLAVIERCQDEQLDPKAALRLLNQLIIDSVQKQEAILESSTVPNAYSSLMKARDMERTGRKVIHLEVGEPDFEPPELVKTSLKEALDLGYSKYSESAGIADLREKIANHLNEIQNTNVSSDQVIVTPGARFAIVLSVLSRIQRGDEVIILDPSYPAYTDIVRESGGRTIHVPTFLENDWIPNMDLVESRINESTKMMILNSPSNPTGKVLTRSTLQSLVDLAIEHDIQILSDEVYSRFTSAKHPSVLEFPECSQVFVDSFSKTYRMSGYRIGYAVSDVSSIQRMTQLQNIFLTSIPEFIQYAGLNALDCKEDVERYAATIRQRRDHMCKLLRDLPLSFCQPDGGFYIFSKLETEKFDGVQFSEKLLEEQGVSVVPGIAYGSDYSHFFRISVCQPEKDLIKAAGCIKEVLQ